MRSLWRLGGRSWLELARRVWHEVQEDSVFGRAAELSYYLRLARRCYYPHDLAVLYGRRGVDGRRS
jgi:hypothetical protein